MMNNFDWRNHQVTSVEQFYSDEGVVRIGYVDGRPFIAHNPKLANGTDNRKYDYSIDRTLMFVFEKPLEMEKLIEHIDICLNAQYDHVEPPGVTFGRYTRNWNYNIKDYNDIIYFGRVGIKGQLVFELKDRNIIIYHRFNNYDSELKLIKRFFERNLDKLLSPEAAKEIAFAPVNKQSYFSTNDTVVQESQYLRNNNKTVAKQDKIIKGQESDIDMLVGGSNG